MLPPRASFLRALSALAAPLVLAACSGAGSPASSTLFPDATPVVDAAKDTSTPAVDAGSAHDATPLDAAADAPLDGDAAAPADATLDGGADAAVDAFFPTALHTAPHIPANGGPTLAHPTVVTVTFAGDPERATVEQLDSYLVTSPWLGAVGPEYGVGLGTNVNVELTMAAPATVDDLGIQAILESIIAAGTVPDPDGGVTGNEVSPSLDGGAVDGGPDGWNGLDGGPPVRLPGAIYMMFFPSTTNITVDGTPMCSFSAGGYHSQTALVDLGQAFAYGVITECPNATQSDLVQTVSHEIIEAATDPSIGDTGYRIVDTNDPWAIVGGEVGDLCAFVTPQWSEGAYSGIQRVYSNASAAAGGDPCLPAPEAYYGTDAVPRTAQAVAAGSSIVYTITGWSTAALPDWDVSAQVYTSVPSTFQPTFQTSVTTLNNGLTGTVTVGVPAGTASGSYALGLVYSYTSQTDYTTTLLEIYVP
jgi:hypothetical protein